MHPLESFLDFTKEKEIINSLKSYMGLQLFDENIYNRVKNQEDPFMLKALNQLNQEDF